MTDKFTDVHTFDTKLIGLFNDSKREIVSQSKIDKLKDMLSLHAKHMYVSILNEPQNKNYDGTNKINAQNVLIDIISRINLEEQSMVKLLDEQLSDAALLGGCPQGRSTRLLQIWSIF